MQGRASAGALTREAQIQRETDASPILSEWSSAALPDDVIRLHSRPAFSSARDYLDWLSARDKLPGAGQ
jgi:LysB family phage lysis regulatory protein